MSIPVNIVVIGDEILSGAVRDANGFFLASHLTPLGFSVESISVARDDKKEIESAIRRAVEGAGLVILSGGLGPTDDDITRDVVAEICGAGLEQDSDSLARMKSYYSKLNRPINDNSLRQTYFPCDSEILPNPVGTADAFWVELLNSSGDVVPLIALPGVPKEIEILFGAQVVGKLQEHFPDLEGGEERYLRCFGVSESYIGSKVGAAELPEGVGVTYRPQYPEILVSFIAKSKDAKKNLDSACQIATEAIGNEFVFSHERDATLANAVGELLREKGLTVAFAESCTGGRIADRIVSVAGASDYFLASLVTYSNQAKEVFLGVSSATLEEHGAVSEEVAREMAQGAREKTGASMGISVTGVAGPDGGNSDKPVGTVWFGLSTEEETTAVSHRFVFERNAFRSVCAAVAMDIIRRHLYSLPLEWEKR